MLSQSDPPGTAVSGLSGPNTCRACSGPAEATAVPTSRPGPGYGVPSWGLVLRVGRAQAQTPALKWQQPQAFFMPTSAAEACLRLHTNPASYQPSFTLQSVALERVIISTSGQDCNHKKKNGNSIHWN